MKKLFKIVSGLVLFVLLAIVALVVTFDANNYKDQIIEQVEQQTGRKFKIDGDINLSLFPWVGLKVEKVALGNAQGFSERAFAEIAQLDVKVMVLPLLKKEVHIDKISLHGLSASLEIDEQGRNNWSDLSQASSEDAVKENIKTSETAQAPAGTGAALAGFAINGIEFVNANISWRDAKTDTTASVSALSLETSAIKFDEPVDVEFSAHVVSNQPEVDATISLQTKVKFNQALNIIDVNELKLNVQSLMKSVSKEMIALDIKTDAHVDLKQQTATLKSVEVSALGAVLSANFYITQLDTTPQVKGSVSTNDINGRALARQLQIEMPPMANATSLSRFTLESEINATPTSVRLNKFKIDLDQSQIVGWVNVLDLAQPNINYSLKMNQINLDDYMAPTPLADKPMVAQPAPIELAAGRSGAESNADIEIPLPVELLRTLGLNGVFEIGSATFQEIVIRDVSITTQAGSGLVRIKPVTMNLLDGRIEAGVDLDVRQLPAYTIAITASDLHAGPIVNPILKGMMGDEEIKLEGAVQLTADIATSGQSLMALKKAATGKVNFDMNQTSVTGVDIQYFARNAVVDYLVEKKLDVSPEWRGEYEPKQTTAFRKIHASAIVAQGRISNDDFIMDSRRIVVTGKGVVDIVNNTMDYNSLIDLTLESKKTFAEKLLDEPMGVHIHGPFEKLAIDPDTKNLAKVAKNLIAEKAKAEAGKKIEAEKEQLKAKVEQEKEEARKKLEDKLRNKLKGLF